MDWHGIIKPILSTNYGNLHKTDITNIIKAIIKSENDFFDNENTNQQFFQAFAALAADIISGQCNCVCQTQMPQILEASSILIRFLLKRFSTASASEVKWLLPPLKSLCEGTHQISLFDHTIVTSILKSCKVPESKTNVSTSSASDKDSPKSEMKRSRSDLSSVILQQLTTPLNANNSTTWAPLSEELTDCTQMFTSSNLSYMQSLNACDVILDTCSVFPILLKYRLKYEECIKSNSKNLYLPLTHAEAVQIKNSYQQMSLDISILAQALQLPILEPLTPERIKKLSEWAMSALYCAVLASISTSVLAMSSSSSQKDKPTSSGSNPSQASKESSSGNTPSSTSEDTEENARLIVDKAIEIYTNIGNLFKKSARVHIYQNHLCFGAWLLITGMQGTMNASSKQSSSTSDSDSMKGKSPARGATTDTPPAPSSTSSRVNFFKVQQGFGVLNAAFTNHSLVVLKELIEDLKIESRSGDDNVVTGSTSQNFPEPSGFDILEQYSSIQRVIRVLGAATLQQLLTFLATVSYRKACTLKRANAKDHTEHDPISLSDSTTYFNETMSCSDESETEDDEEDEEEEDSESYLGQWFKETLSPEVGEESTNKNLIAQDTNLTENGQKSNSVATKDEPRDYLELSSHIFTFLDESLGTKHKFLVKYVKAGLSDQQMVLLANILKDLDRDSLSCENPQSNNENNVCPQWQASMYKFSGALGRYLHNLISGMLLSESLQSNLLLHLGVSPWTQETNTWPLQIYPRTLSVLVQILILKPTHEKEAACLSVWHRLVNTLVEGICSPVQTSSDCDYEDLNKEHAQLLLFLFHSLNLMQKKSILLLTAGGVIRCADLCRNVSPEKPLKDVQLMLLSRLLLFLEYLMKHLYNAPTALLEQVRWNLFNVLSLDGNQKVADVLNNKTKMASFCKKDIEDRLKKFAEYNMGVRPKFYTLSVNDGKIPPEFKLDGLAWNFILCTPDKLKYPLLIDALIDILKVTDMAVAHRAIYTRCSVNYCFGIAWKLLLGLPPSTDHVEALMEDHTPNLHSLIWAIRCLHPVGGCHYLIVNSLVKQGMYTQSAETLWKDLTGHVSDIKYSIKLTIAGLEDFLNKFTNQNPNPGNIILLDAVVAHMHALFWSEKEASKTQTSENELAEAQSETQPEKPDVTKIDLSKDLLLKLLKIIEVVREKVNVIMCKNVCESIPPKIFNGLIQLCSSKPSYCSEIASQFTNTITGQDKEYIINEWKKAPTIPGEESFSVNNFPAEHHTLNVIEFHLNEISLKPNFNHLPSYKHTLKSIVFLINKLIPVCKNDPYIVERLKNILISMIFDVRMEYLYDICKKSLEELLGCDQTSEEYQLLAYNLIVKQSYEILIEYASGNNCQEMSESIFLTIIKNLEEIMNKPMGMKAMAEFFHYSKQGQLTELLLSFTGTSLSQTYATKILQIFEKLLHLGEKSDSKFPMDELSQCIIEIGSIDTHRLKNWLSHILLGPKQAEESEADAQKEQSPPSSNAQTPTAATVSEIVQSLETDALETNTATTTTGDEAVAISNTNNSTVPGAITSSISGGNWPSCANSFFQMVNETNDENQPLENNGKLLQNITKHLVQEGRVPQTVSLVLFHALIQLGQSLLIPQIKTSKSSKQIHQNVLDFSELLQIMITLADAADGRGHVQLFSSAINWLDVAKQNILDSNLPSLSKNVLSVDNVTALFRYMTDLLQGLGYKGSRSISPPWEDEMQTEFDDFIDEFTNLEGGEESTEMDSDEDSLQHKLCTYSQTQKEFMNQHWYHCHTCNMINTVGVCSVCARVCHKNHDVSYSKYGNFFCDCGAKEDGFCQALSRRTHEQSQPSTSGHHLSSLSSADYISDHASHFSSFAKKRAQAQHAFSALASVNTHQQSSGMSERAAHMAKVIESSKESLKSPEQWLSVVQNILQFLESLMSSIKANCSLFSTVGCHKRAQEALNRLHEPTKSFEVNDNIMLPTLGSQEGAFENVRMSYAGDQGQTIKQLLSSGLVRRVALCCLSSPHGKRQHLAVSHEKGKVTILQLSALLKQADAAKRKLTLTQLSSAPIPCTVLSITANPANEDCLAVCGLKECHILTFSTTGVVNDHIVLTPQLETGNFIKKAIWLPGSQTKLALVTADFVKIYELAEDTYSPQYYFLVAVGKIRDCTFVYQSDGTYYMFLIASSGYIYYQPLDDESLAEHGDFYVTNTLELNHPLIKDLSGQIGGGGVSIYYSHMLQVLFFSYSLGRSFMAPLVNVNEGVKSVQQLQVNPVVSKNSSKGPPQPLCQWTEILGHPGLVCAMMHTSNNPVIFMIKPDTILTQEIKAQSSKAKIMDMVAIRHIVSGVEKTTLILLCEDGSLRIFTANVDVTNYWLSPEVLPIGNQINGVSKSSAKKNKKSSTAGKNQKSALSSSGQPVFPIDYFEHCTIMPDVEFGGNDLLQIYNTQKLKTRLMTTGTFVVCTKSTGFTLEVINSDPNMVIVGIRVQIGNQDPQRAPQSVTILGRTVMTPVRRARWFDIPLTREESLQSDKKLSIHFGRSHDVEDVTMLDSIEIYGKTKDVFGWPEDTEDVVGGTSSAQNTNTANQQSSSGTTDLQLQTVTSLDRMLTSMLEVLDSGLELLSGSNMDLDPQLRNKCIALSTILILNPCPNPVQNQAKCVLATLLGNRQSYHIYKDTMILKSVFDQLKELDAIESVQTIDPELFYRLVILTRSIALARSNSLAKICAENDYNILPLLLKLTKKLYEITPMLEEPTSVVRRGLSHVETTIHCLVEIIYAFALSDASKVEEMTKYLIELLIDPSKIISHSTKDAIIHLISPRLKRRKVVIVSPPACSTPTPPPSAVQDPEPPQAEAQPANNDFVPVEVDAIEPLGLEAVAAGGNNPFANLEAYLNAGRFPQLLDLQQDADDEAIMDIAIALSLQRHDADPQALQHGLASLANLQGIRNVAGSSANSNAAGSSGSGVEPSAGGSDDEASNAATDGSTLRTSPAEPAGSGGSESGGSGVESIGGASGRSSTYGDQPTQSPPRNNSGEVQQIAESVPSTSTAIPENIVSVDEVEQMETENLIKLHNLRCTILNKIIENLSFIDNVNGHQAIPLLQVILMLTSDLDGNQEQDQLILNKLLTVLVERLEINPTSQSTQLTTRKPKTEVQLVILCLFGVLMGKSKSSKHHAGSSSPPLQYKDNATFVASTTANILTKSGIIPYCLVIMESFLPYWKQMSTTSTSHGDCSIISGGGTGSSSANSAQTNNLLKAINYGPKPDLSTLIPHNYLKNCTEIFESYNSLVTELAVRLSCQTLKLSTGHPQTYEWFNKSCETMTFTLCEYMMLNLSAPIRRQVRKLLMFLCGNKEKFRMFRDDHSLNVHLTAIKKFFDLKSGIAPNMNYDSLVEFTEHLRNCQEIAQIRTGNWQKFCIVHDDIIPALIQISCYQLDDGVSPIILQLLQAALCKQPESKTSSSSKSRSERDKSEENEMTYDSKFDPAHCFTFVYQIFKYVPDQMLSKFIAIFLLETNITSIRWQAHSLIFAIYENSNEQQKERLLKILWNMWQLLPVYGRRTAQFVDILGYLTLSTQTISSKLPEYTEKAVSVLRQQNELLSKHPNGPLYTALGQVLDIDGYYLESEPCLVCNNPEVPMSNIKLTSIKSDSKFTTTTMIVKLVQSHTISKIILRITDLKRTKMVRAINVYYNNRTVQAVVELKNKPALWHKAKTVALQSGQTEMKIDFPLPITACNLMIEYSDFYEVVSSISENLTCPRCSAAVPSYPGVCANCGENVFQCHKCRAINYDEKDPFLCHACGFCKYAKFDFSIYGRACCAVDPIESAEDRAKTVTTIHTLLEKADRIYRLQLQSNKQILELFIQKIAEPKFDRNLDENIIGLSSSSGSSQVNKVIQLLAQKYCVESKTSFEELSKVVQKVKACRKELVAYDRSQMDLTASTTKESYTDFVVANKCFGCALASTEQCLTLLRAMASNIQCRKNLCEQGLIEELTQNNLRRGTVQIQDEVRHLLCLLTREVPDSCNKLLKLITDRVKITLNGVVPLANLDVAVRHEMILLEVLIAQDDFCWEQKLKVVFELFLIACRDSRGPIIAVIQPCLRIIQALICPAIPSSKAHKDLTTADLATICQNITGISVDFQKWLKGDENHSFESWKGRMPKNNSSVFLGCKKKTPPPEDQGTQVDRKKRKRIAYLSEKYGKHWQRRTMEKDTKNTPLTLNASWIQPVLFNTNSLFGRQLACSLITCLSRTYERKKEILNLLTGFLKNVGDIGEASAEFLILYKNLAMDPPWLQYLALKGVLVYVAELLKNEIEKIHRLEDTSLSSDLAQGYALRRFVDLMSMFLDDPKIRQTYKGKLLGPVLQGYLSLRKLVVQRTRLIDDAQEKLLELLEEMTTGTEEETRAFMAILIDTVEQTPLNDIKTPVFIFERLYSIIHPEENDESEFFLTLDKDPQQEDFLQGRMLGNPYPSSEQGLGPLMRDVKNKICTDCELIALLEDDNGMELLVHNKIISLDLPVKEVYKKIWLAEGGERDAMRVVYRMRGLLGEATEEFIETLNNKSQEEVDNEQLYKMANVLADCDGLKVMLERISSLQNISRTRELVQVLLKLFLIAVKVRRCQEVLCQPELGAINTLLKVLQMCLQSENDVPIQSTVTEQLLDIMETILSKAASDTLDTFLQFSLTFGGPEYVTALISCTNCSNVRNNPSVLRHLIRVLAALVYGNEVKMALLSEHFKGTLDFNKFDTDRTPEDEFKMELFCVLTNQIEHNSIGGTLKDYIVGMGIVDQAIKYIEEHAPCVKPTLVRTDTDDLKEFISRPSLKYILRFLTGLATKHEATQVAVSMNIIPIIHRLEQVSSDEHVGSLAENLLEALCTNDAAAKRVQEVRDFTRAEKKRLAMATREKQLDALGMRTNEKGQVTAKGSILQKIEKLREETGLTCFICREGYACQPSKVLGIYTFTKKTNVEDFEMKPRKTQGYTTVTHFNVVHVDCHSSAIRSSRGRDEWERASLQNANTRCNGLLPLWGPDIAEAVFTLAMQRHTTYMQESTQRCDISFGNSIHDLKLLLNRFAWEKSFHEDAGGGGPQSNMHLVPYLLFYSVYMLISSRSATREDKTLVTYLTTAPNEKWLECAYEVEGPLYLGVLSLAIHNLETWEKYKIAHMKRLLAIAQVRHVSPNVLCKALITSSDRTPKEYSVYKPYLMFWALLDLIYNNVFKPISFPKDGDWQMALFDYIRKNDEAMLKNTDKILSTFTDEFLPCTSFSEFCDVAGLYESIENPDEFLNELLNSLPSPSSSSSSG